MHHFQQLGQQLLVIAARGVFFLALALVAPSALYILSVLVVGQVRAYRSPLQNVPGPKKARLFSGNFVDVLEPDSSRLQEEWVTTYGHVTKYHSRFGVRSHSNRYNSIVMTRPLADAQAPHRRSRRRFAYFTR